MLEAIILNALMLALIAAWFWVDDKVKGPPID